MPAAYETMIDVAVFEVRWLCRAEQWLDMTGIYYLELFPRGKALMSTRSQAEEDTESSVHHVYPAGVLVSSLKTFVNYFPPRYHRKPVWSVLL